MVPVLSCFLIYFSHVPDSSSSVTQIMESLRHAQKWVPEALVVGNRCQLSKAGNDLGGTFVQGKIEVLCLDPLITAKSPHSGGLSESPIAGPASFASQTQRPTPSTSA